MNTLLKILVLTALFFETGSAGKQFFELLYPPQHISRNVNTVHVIGRTSAPIIEIYVNGEKFSDAIIYDSTFHEEINYGFGVNEIEIKPIFSGPVEGIQESYTVEVMYAPVIDKKFLRIYPKYEFHNSTPKELCVQCHKGDVNDISSMTDAALCLECHQNLKESFKQHTKIDSSTCTICHSMGKNLTGSFAGAEFEDNPCFKCHPDRIGLFSQEFIHGPVAGGTCTICHSPHGSDYEKSLNAPVQILCISCHEDIEDEMQKEVVHKPFKDGHCADCHDPHATNNKWVLVKSSEEICLGCHNPDKNLAFHKHPYNVKPKRKLKVDLKLTERGKLECVSCHNPHATRSDHLLRINQEFTCIGCHTDIL